MPAPRTVSDLINEVRDQIDEVNTTTVSDQDILQALNRGQNYGVEILSKHYPEPFIGYRTIVLSSGAQDYALPEDLYSDRVLVLEIDDTRVHWEVPIVSFREAYRYETTQTTSIPSAAVVFGRTIRFYPEPSGTYNARMWYVKKPETLVKDQGRITSVATGQFNLDSVGAYDATTNPYGLEEKAGGTEEDRLTCWANVVDAQTGEIKGSYEIQTITGQLVSIQTGTLLRSSVLGKTIGTSLASTIAADDYVCNIRGTGVMYFPEPLDNFVIQYAVAEIRRRLSDNPELELGVLKNFEAQVKSTWAGRPSTLKVKRRSPYWSRTGLRKYLLDS